MPSVIIIEKNASVKSHNIKVFSEDELYKKAGFKSKEGFSRQTVWNVEIDKTTYSIELYGKTTGRAGQENKYDFPPPVDHSLFFGGCVLIRRKGDEIVNLTENEWNKIYEHLFGGFEDIGEDDSEEASEDELSDDVPLTKNGYVKDGFVVDDDCDNEEDVCSSEEEYRIAKKTPKPSKMKINAKAKTHAMIYPDENVKIIMDTSPVSVAEDITYLGCTNELEEEPYV
jgi:hypothetical protein